VGGPFFGSPPQKKNKGLGSLKKKNEFFFQNAFFFKKEFFPLKESPLFFLEKKKLVLKNK